MIVVGGNPLQYAKDYRSVERAPELDNPYAMPYETNVPIYILRGRRTPFVWAAVKRYN